MSAFGGPVQLHSPSFVLRIHMPHKTFTGRTFILIILDNITEGISPELAFGPVARSQRFGYIRGDAVYLRYLRPISSIVIASYRNERNVPWNVTSPWRP